MAKQLRFRAQNREIFEAIKDGRKKVETRAASPKFSSIKTGDIILLVCGNQKFERKINMAAKFKTIEDLLEKYQIKEINPFVNSLVELKKMYFGFPGYRKKIKKYGLMAFEIG